MSALKLTLRASPVIAVATIGLCCLTQWGAKFLFGIDLPEQSQLLAVRNTAGFNAEFMKILAMVLIVAPVAEEIVFRFLLFRLPLFVADLLRKFDCRKTALALTVLLAAVSAAIFSTAHYPDWNAIKATGDWTWLPLSNAFLALFFFGLAQCWLYRKTKWLWSPMLNHFIFNLTNLVLMFILPV